MLDSFSIATSIHRDLLAVDTSWQMLDSSSIDKTRVLILDTSWSVENYVFLYIGSMQFSLIFLRTLSIDSLFSHSKTPQTQPLHLPYLFFGLFIAFFTSMISFLAFNHTFHAFWPWFWVFFFFFINFLVFFEIDEVLAKFLGWVLLKWFLKHHALYHTCIITIFSCIIHVCYICWFAVCC